MSLGEVLSLYRDGDLDVHPEFQRIFRWNEEQKSRLIESILLGIPIPPIFVSQRNDGVWDVIDGVQRLSTIFEFMGVYRDHLDRPVPPASLSATEYLPDLAGYTWEPTGSSVKSFSDAMRRDVKRSKLEFRIIRKESDPNAKYDLFQRLNSGSQLSPQETRNCLLVMINTPMYERVVALSRDQAFLECVPLSEQKEDQAYRQELVLRFFSQYDYDGPDSELPVEHGEYITSWMRAAAETGERFDKKLPEALMTETFKVLRRALGEDTFRRYDGARHLGPFSIASFEFVTAGVSANLAAWRDDANGLKDRIREIWTSPDFRDNSGTGVSPRRRVPKLVNKARIFFRRDA
jgi:hypothetical protein